MYFKKIDVLIKLLFLTLLTVLSSCSRKEAPARRLPQGNANSLDYNFSDAQNDQKVKRVDEYYDAYQRYQSNEAPVSLQDLKKVRRRPVLNIQALNDIMDSSYSKTHQEKPHQRAEEEYLDDAQTPCTESDCDIEKTIKYNKRKAKKHKFKAKKQNHDSAQAAENTKAKAATKKTNLAKISPATTEPQPKLTQAAPAAVKEQSTSPKQVNTEKTLGNAATTMKNVIPALPPVSLPEATIIAKPALDSAKQVEIATKPVAPKTIAPVAPAQPQAMPVAPIIAKPTITSPSTVKNETAASTENSNILNTPPSTTAPVAVAKLNKYTKETKLDTFNNLLVKYIFTIKSKIVSIFNSEE